MTFTNDVGPSFHPPAASIKGIPTQEELDALPHNYTWEDLQWIISKSGDLGYLKREPSLQQRYEHWCDGIVAEHGSIESYLKTVRLPWPASELVIPDAIETRDKPYLRAPLTDSRSASSSMSNISAGFGTSIRKPSSDVSGEEEPYLRWTGKLDPKFYAVLRNDWPYNVPSGVEHCCVWSKVPTAHPALVDYDQDAWELICQEGLAGFTGIADERSEQRYETVGGQEIGKMVKGLWPEEYYETIWFVNPPRLQSVRGLSHFHVFARRKGHAQDCKMP